jgi:tRNA pseudouridine55 synthase
MGHGGTLDPMATGVLPVFIGRATRMIEYMDSGYKTYRCTAKLGVDTDTMDIWGTTLREGDATHLSPDEIEEALMSFQGHIQQVPPMYSALKVKGKRLYQYAREGQEVEIKPRQVHIKLLRILTIRAEQAQVEFLVTCSKGTYIRSICHDLGEKLGCGATMMALERTESGPFDLSRSVSPEELKNMDEEGIEKVKATIYPIDYAVSHLSKAVMPLDRAKYFVSGNGIWLSQVSFRDGLGCEPVQEFYRVYCEETGQFLGTGHQDREEGILKPDKIFITRQEL